MIQRKFFTIYILLFYSFSLLIILRTKDPSEIIPRNR